LRVVALSETVSIIIVTFERKESLRRCLNSVIGSSYSNTEITVVEDPSPVGFVTLQLAVEFPNVTFIRNSRRLGIAKSRNIGINQASGKYLFFVDDDNVLDPLCIQSLVGTLMRNKDVGFVGPVSYYLENPAKIWNAGVKIGKLTRRHINMKQFASATPFQVDVIPNAYMARKDVVEKIGRFDDSNFYIQEEEHDIEYRAVKLGYKLVIDPTARVWHDYPFTNSIRLTPEIGYDIWKSRVVFERKHHNPNLWIFVGLVVFVYLPYYCIDLTRGNKGNLKFGRIVGAMYKGFADGMLFRIHTESMYSGKLSLVDCQNQIIRRP
jgi:GT2 family glycosyltransferase